MAAASSWVIAEGSADALDCAAGSVSRSGVAGLLRPASAAAGEADCGEVAFVVDGFVIVPADAVAGIGAAPPAPPCLAGDLLVEGLPAGGVEAGFASGALAALAGGAGVFAAGAFLAGAFLAGDFFAGVFFAGAFFAGVLRTGPFFAGALRGAGFFRAGAFAGAFLAGDFLAGAFFTAAFLAGAFFTAVFFAGACFVAAFFVAAFFAAVFLPATFFAVRFVVAFAAFFATAMLDLLVHWAGGKGVGSPRSAGKNELSKAVIALSGWTGAEYSTRGGIRQCMRACLSRRLRQQRWPKRS
ncbi:MAG: hypothetical protein R3F08_12550 [Dokdonella sp.]